MHSELNRSEFLRIIIMALTASGFKIPEILTSYFKEEPMKSVLLSEYLSLTTSSRTDYPTTLKNLGYISAYCNQPERINLPEFRRKDSHPSVFTKNNSAELTNLIGTSGQKEHEERMKMAAKGLEIAGFLLTLNPVTWPVGIPLTLFSIISDGDPTFNLFAPIPKQEYDSVNRAIWNKICSQLEVNNNFKGQVEVWIQSGEIPINISPTQQDYLTVFPDPMEKLLTLLESADLNKLKNDVSAQKKLFKQFAEYLYGEIDGLNQKYDALVIATKQIKDQLEKERNLKDEISKIQYTAQEINNAASIGAFVLSEILQKPKEAKIFQSTLQTYSSISSAIGMFKLEQIGTFSLVNTVLTGGISIFSAFSSGPTIEEVILSKIDRISKQIAELYQYVAIRFSEIERTQYEILQQVAQISADLKLLRKDSIDYYNQQMKMLELVVDAQERLQREGQQNALVTQLNLTKVLYFQKGNYSDETLTKGISDHLAWYFTYAQTISASTFFSSSSDLLDNNEIGMEIYKKGRWDLIFNLLPRIGVLLKLPYVFNITGNPYEWVKGVSAFLETKLIFEGWANETNVKLLPDLVKRGFEIKDNFLKILQPLTLRSAINLYHKSELEDILGVSSDIEKHLFETWNNIVQAKTLPKITFTVLKTRLPKEPGQIVGKSNPKLFGKTLYLLDNVSFDNAYEINVDILALLIDKKIIEKKLISTKSRGFLTSPRHKVENRYQLIIKRGFSKEIVIGNADSCWMESAFDDFHDDDEKWIEVSWESEKEIQIDLAYLYDQNPRELFAIRSKFDRGLDDILMLLFKLYRDLVEAPTLLQDVINDFTEKFSSPTNSQITSFRATSGITRFLFSCVDWLKTGNINLSPNPIISIPIIGTIDELIALHSTYFRTNFQIIKSEILNPIEILDTIQKGNRPIDKYLKKEIGFATFSNQVSDRLKIDKLLEALNKFLNDNSVDIKTYLDKIVFPPKDEEILQKCYTEGFYNVVAKKIILKQLFVKQLNFEEFNYNFTGVVIASPISMNPWFPHYKNRIIMEFYNSRKNLEKMIDYSITEKPNSFHSPLDPNLRSLVGMCNYHEISINELPQPLIIIEPTPIDYENLIKEALRNIIANMSRSYELARRPVDVFRIGIHHGFNQFEWEPEILLPFYLTSKKIFFTSPGYIKMFRDPAGLRSFFAPVLISCLYILDLGMTTREEVRPDFERLQTIFRELLPIQWKFKIKGDLEVEITDSDNFYEYSNEALKLGWKRYDDSLIEIHFNENYKIAGNSSIEINFLSKYTQHL